MTTKTLTTNASLYSSEGFLLLSGLTVQTRTGGFHSCETVIIGGTEHRADEVEIGNGEATLSGGNRLVWNTDAEPTSKLILECTRTQKGRYVRAAAGRKLVDWCLEKLDAAAHRDLVNAEADLVLTQQAQWHDWSMHSMDASILDGLARAAGYESGHSVCNEHNLWQLTVAEAVQYLRDSGSAD